MSQAALNLHTAPGYLVLAAAGKTVLRPGGRAATKQLFEWANFQPGDTVLELASGLGTSAIALAQRYDISVVGIEKDPGNAAIARARAAGLGDRVQIVQGSIFQLESLPQQFDYVLAEAILTMQSPSGKARILQGIRDRLKPGGKFLSHEMIVRTPLDQIHQDLSQVLRVNATPLTEADWAAALQEAGLTITNRKTGAMRLLNPGQLLQDEGVAGTSKLVWNILTQPVLRDRILAMRRVFAQHQHNLSYIVLSANKTACAEPTV